MAAADVIRDAAVQLREAGIETPEHDAKLLLAEAAGVELRDVDKALLMGEELGTAEQCEFRPAALRLHGPTMNSAIY